VNLVITDFAVPKMNGIKFVEQLHSINPRIPVIFVTGYLSVIAGKTLLQDVSEIREKPFEFDALRSAAQRVLPVFSHSERLIITRRFRGAKVLIVVPH
jgi:DNA-binding NtrC family response regulator